MEKLILIGKIEKIKINVDKNGKEYSTFIIYWNVNTKDSVVETKRNCITNNQFIINKIKQTQENSVVYIEGTPKASTYKSNNGEIVSTYSINNIFIFEVLDNNGSFMSIKRPESNNTTQVENNEKVELEDIWKLDF